MSRVKVDQKNCQMDFELKGCKVFATANEINRLSKPLQSRFRKLFLPRYTEEQFGGDIRDVISIGRLVRKSDGPQEIELIMETMSKYGMEKRELLSHDFI